MNYIYRKDSSSTYFLISSLGLEQQNDQTFFWEYVVVFVVWSFNSMTMFQKTYQLKFSSFKVTFSQNDNMDFIPQGQNWQFSTRPFSKSPSLLKYSSFKPWHPKQRSSVLKFFRQVIFWSEIKSKFYPEVSADLNPSMTLWAFVAVYKGLQQMFLCDLTFPMVSTLNQTGRISFHVW